MESKASISSFYILQTFILPLLQGEANWSLALCMQQQFSVIKAQCLIRVHLFTSELQQFYYSKNTGIFVPFLCSISKYISHLSFSEGLYSTKHCIKSEMRCYRDRLSSCCWLKLPLKTKRLTAGASRVVSRPPKLICLNKWSCNFLIIPEGLAAAAWCLYCLQTTIQVSYNWPGTNCMLSLDKEVTHGYILNSVDIEEHS